MLLNVMMRGFFYWQWKFASVVRIEAVRRCKSQHHKKFKKRVSEPKAKRCRPA